MWTGAPAGRLSGQGRLGVELVHNTDRSPEKSLRKMPSGAEKMFVPKSEISLGNAALGDFWRRGPESQNQKLP